MRNLLKKWLGLDAVMVELEVCKRKLRDLEESMRQDRRKYDETIQQLAYVGRRFVALSDHLGIKYEDVIERDPFFSNYDEQQHTFQAVRVTAREPASHPDGDK